jgi:GTP cyclohydrolase FolE2
MDIARPAHLQTLSKIQNTTNDNNYAIAWMQSMGQAFCKNTAMALYTNCKLILHQSHPATDVSYNQPMRVSTLLCHKTTDPDLYKLVLIHAYHKACPSNIAISRMPSPTKRKSYGNSTPGNLLSTAPTTFAQKKYS